MASDVDGPSLARLRDAVVSGSPTRVATALLALFDHVDTLRDKVQWVHRNVAADLPGARDAALERACAAVAATIDAQPAKFDRHSYHNRQHFCEVALTAHGLAQLHGLPTHAAQFVLLAALIHDVVHEGRPHTAFVQERASVDSMRPLLLAAGLTAHQVDRLRVLVLATDPVGGTTFTSACCQAHAGNAPMPSQPPVSAPELAMLTSDGQLAQLARLLCEADVLPSVGLDPAHALCVQERLAREWQRPLDRHDKLAFLDSVLHRGYIGPFFLPCVHATRAVLAAGLHATAEG